MVRKQRTDIYTNNIRFGTAALLIAAFLVASASPGAAIDENAAIDRDRFRLWNECSPIALSVPDLSEVAATIGLAKDTIEVTVRSRLRAARLYSPTVHASLVSVNLTVLELAYRVGFDYYKVVTDSATKLRVGFESHAARANLRTRSMTEAA